MQSEAAASSLRAVDWRISSTSRTKAKAPRPAASESRKVLWEACSTFSQPLPRNRKERLPTSARPGPPGGG